MHSHEEKKRRNMVEFPEIENPPNNMVKDSSKRQALTLVQHPLQSVEFHPNVSGKRLYK